MRKDMKPKPVRPTTDPAELSMNTQPSELVRPIDARDAKHPVQQMKQNSMVILAVYVVLILFGLGTGYILSHKSTSGAAMVVTTGTAGNPAKVAGVQDASKFTNCPVGTLDKGGIDGEGTHHLTRPGGPSQTAYLISSIIDLDQYVGLKVKVCGATLQALKAPWLMDVERLEVQ